MGQSFSDAERTKIIDDVLDEKPIDIDSEYDNENLLCYSKNGQPNYLKQTLNSIIDFLLLLVTLYVVSCFKILHMSWY